MNITKLNGIAIGKVGKMCADKVQYLSSQEAHREAKRFKKKKKKNGDSNYILTVYHCPVCGFWHITSKKRHAKFKEKE